MTELISTKEELEEAINTLLWPLKVELAILRAQYPEHPERPPTGISEDELTEPMYKNPAIFRGSREHRCE